MQSIWVEDVLILLSFFLYWGTGTGRNEKQGSNQKYSNIIQHYDDDDDAGHDVRSKGTAGNGMSELLDHLMTKRYLFFIYR